MVGDDIGGLVLQGSLDLLVEFWGRTYRWMASFLNMR